MESSADGTTYTPSRMSGKDPMLKNGDAIGETTTVTRTNSPPTNIDDLVRPSRHVAVLVVLTGRREHALPWSAPPMPATVITVTTAMKPARRPYSSTLRNRPTTI